MKKRTNGKAFFDTNVLVYAFQRGGPRSESAQRLLTAGGVIGVQSLNEFAAVARRKLKMSWADVLAALDAIRTLCPSPAPLSIETHEAALKIAARLNYGMFDSLIIAAALEARCEKIYSEDLQAGQVIEGLRIENPFELTAE